MAESTGVDVAELLGTGGASVVSTEYSKRGPLKSVGGSYGALVASVTRDADGLTQQITYGDVAQTNTSFQYDLRNRIASVLTHRGPPALWSQNPAAYSPAPDPGGAPSVFQTTLEHYNYAYDVVDNPTETTDLRDPSAWPASFKPSTRRFQYDDLYRLKHVEYVGDEDWSSPFNAENGDVTGQRSQPSPHVSFAKRVATQSFTYDAVGNTTATDDDAHGFYDRSLGTITNGTSTAGPYQLKHAVQASGSRSGELTAAYDDAGNLTSLALQRSGPCLPTGAICSQRFSYDWDEVGNLARARRWDTASPGTATDSLPSSAPAVELRYTYAGNERVLKTAVDPSSSELHTVYVFGSLELRRTHFLSGDYERTSGTVAPYLFANGVRLARLYYATTDVPTLSSGHLHVLFELPDHLGSSSFVIDQATSELVEATRYQAYGATESDYRPERWKEYRDDYRFTGKEEDIEVGLTYFGARYLSAYLNRWVSPDPLAVHQPGEADLNVYAYVHGQVLRAVDPFGLDGAATDSSGGPSTPEQIDEYHPEPGVTNTVTHPGASTSSPDAPAASPSVGAEYLSRPPEGWGSQMGDSARIDTPNITLPEVTIVGRAPRTPSIEPYRSPPAARTQGSSTGSGGGLPTITGVRAVQRASIAPPNEYPAIQSSIQGREREEFVVQVVAPIALTLLTEGALPAAAERAPNMVAGSIRNVNAVNKGVPLALQKNCVSCAIATDATLGGSPASAITGGPFSAADVVAHYPGRSFIPANGYSGIETMMGRYGPGSRGIVWGTRGAAEGHMFNVVNQGGVIRFLDAQSGGAATLETYDGLYLLRTH